jgi:hypothetical protein
MGDTATPGTTQDGVRDAAAARSLICDTVLPNDYGECMLHLRGLPSQTKVQELHRYWFETGIPIVIDLKEIDP